MSNDNLNRRLQDFLEQERRGEALPIQAGAQFPLDLAAYRTVFEALDASPGFQLPADFVDRVLTAVTPEPFSWFEKVGLPVAVAALGTGILASYLKTASVQWLDLLQGMATARLDVLGVVLLQAVGVWLSERVRRPSMNGLPRASGA